MRLDKKTIDALWVAFKLPSDSPGSALSSIFGIFIIATLLFLTIFSAFALIGGNRTIFKGIFFISLILCILFYTGAHLVSERKNSSYKI